MIIPTSWTPAQREAYEERAAIKEFCANLPREQAEAEAAIEIALRIGRHEI